MNPYGDNALEYFSCRLNVNYAFLYGPRSEALYFNALVDSDGHVLMPRNFSIGSIGFIEKG